MLVANAKGHTMINHCLTLWPQASPQTLSIWGCSSVKCAALIFTRQVVTFQYRLLKSAWAPGTKCSRYTQIAVVAKPSSVGTCSSAGEPCSSLAPWGLWHAYNCSFQVNLSLSFPARSFFLPFFNLLYWFPSQPTERTKSSWPSLSRSLPSLYCLFTLSFGQQNVHILLWTLLWYH